MGEREAGAEAGKYSCRDLTAQVPDCRALMAWTAARAPVMVVIMGTLKRTAVARSRPSSLAMPLRVGVLISRASWPFLIMSIALGRPSVIFCTRRVSTPCSAR